MLTLASGPGATFDSSRTIFTGSGYGVIVGAINDNAAGANTTYQGFIKSGSGTWMLGGTNSYRTLTTINAGTLALGLSGTVGSSSIRLMATNAVFDVSALTTPGFTLGGGRTLGGIGTVRGTLTVGVGGLVDPGVAGIGTLALDLSGSAHAIFTNGATFNFDLGAPGTNDVIAFGGLREGTNAVSFNGSAINLSDAGGLTEGTYTLFTFDAANAYSGSLTVGSGLSAFRASGFIYGPSNIQLRVANALRHGMLKIR
jgi:autotransporter-associated beta strand protein